MLFSIAMSLPLRSTAAVICSSMLAGLSIVSLDGCKRTEPPPDLIKTQREAMERAKEVGKTMQKPVDAEGKKADEEGK